MTVNCGAAWGWLAVAVILTLVSTGESVCHLDNYIASCVLDLEGEHIEATAIVNHCHLPLDVTFLVSYRYENTTKQKWKYTFVTNNQNEKILIPGLLFPPVPHAPVFLYARVPERDFDMHNSSFVAIVASFMAEMDPEWELEFLNHTIYINTVEDCRFLKVVTDPIPWIVGGLFLITIIIGLLGGGLYLYRKKKLEVDQLALVTSMEVGLPGAHPYQLEAVSDQRDQENTDATMDDQQPQGNTNGSENHGISEVDKPASEGTIDNDKSRGYGFGFEKLKEAQDSVVIGNPAFHDNTLGPSRKTKKRKSSRRNLNGSLPQDHQQDIKIDKVLESYPDKDAQESSLETDDHRNHNSTDKQSSVTEHPLEDSSDDGMPVGQGARRKVRGGLSTLEDTATSVVAPSVHESNSDSQMCL